jgi:hypothetical protein
MTEDNVVDLNTEILISIREQIRQTGTELRSEIGALRTEMKSEIGSLRASVETLELETMRGFTSVRGELTQINGRLDRFIEIAGAGYRNHEVRITALEFAQRRGTTRQRPPTPRR